MLEVSEPPVSGGTALDRVQSRRAIPGVREARTPPSQHTAGPLARLQSAPPRLVSASFCIVPTHGVPPSNQLRGSHRDISS